MEVIQTEKIIAKFKTKGAELCSLQLIEEKLEYIWQGDPQYWPKHSPVLFPFVGGLKNNTYYYKGVEYPMSRHGFARDREFSIENKSADSITFLLKSDEVSRKVYPFDFEFRIRYKVFDTTLMVTYDIINTSKEETMLASVGAHPAFNLPIESHLSYDDYELLFEESENAPIYPLTDTGLIKNTPKPFLKGDRIELKKSLFEKDALVFKNLISQHLTLQSSKGKHGLEFGFDHFPYFGIWAAKGAPFVCLEPWCGIADHEDHQQQLEDKEGMQKLAPEENLTRNWSVTLF